MDNPAIAIESPCQACGACCSYSSNWPRFTTEEDAALDLIPEKFVNERLSGMRCEGDRCSALSGKIGAETSCTIYAVRPDVWTHLAFGRGYGSYEHQSYRVLDMELLRQLIEVGVVGLAAFILMVLSIVWTARAPIRARGPDSRVALAAAATAISFLTVATLFDVMSFPHCPYILLWMAGLLAVSVSTSSEEDDESVA